MSITLEEGYQQFLFLNETPRLAIDHAGADLKKWDSTNGCVVMLEGEAGQACSFKGLTSGVRLMSFTIPHPEIRDNFLELEEPLLAFEPVTFFVGAAVGERYLDYGDAGSSCYLWVTAPGETDSEPVYGMYHEEENRYEFPYTPKTIGKHKFEITYSVSGAKSFSDNLTYEKEVEIKVSGLKGERLRKYMRLSERLKAIQKNERESFELSTYYSSRSKRSAGICGGGAGRPRNCRLGTCRGPNRSRGDPGAR